MIYIIGALGFIGIIVFIKYLYVHHQQNKKIKNDMDYRFVEDDQDIFDCTDCRCTQHYIFTKAGIKRIIPYRDLLWVYIFNQQLLTSRTFGLTLMACTHDGKTYKIMNASGTGRKVMRNFNTVINIINEKNPDCLIGESEENRQKYQSLVKYN